MIKRRQINEQVISTQRRPLPHTSKPRLDANRRNPRITNRLTKSSDPADNVPDACA